MAIKKFLLTALPAIFAGLRPGVILLSLTSFVMMVSCTGTGPHESGDTSSPRPNILIILADDMGFSDIGCFGGEIHTPNIDRLASNGLRYVQFYNAGRCCPTRASLLTGLYQHQTGMGWMTAADLGTAGYTGELNTSCVTLGEVMKSAGYSTYLVGKWHVTSDKHMGPDGPRDSWPLQRGFDKYYGPHNGGGSYFSTKLLTYGNERIQTPADYYVTDALSDSAAAFLLRHDRHKPFFLYLAYTAPHFPLHAKPEDIKKYEGKYRAGWEELRNQRFERMKRLGIIKDNWELSPAEPDVPSWNDLSPDSKNEFDRRMAVYAAQIDNLDQGIGKVMESLRASGQFENTIVFFLSDNGGTSERISRGETGIEKIGTDASFESYRKPWATLSNTPFRMFKQWVHEGGISTPLIVQWPAGLEDRNSLRFQAGHIIDLMPTCIELAGAKYPDSFKGKKILPMEGKSLVPTFSDDVTFDRQLFWEHQATRAVRVGDWKLVADRQLNTPPYILDWELYNLAEDGSEVNDLARVYPEKVKEMDSLWNAWALRCNVYPLDGRGWFERLENQ